jgi:hypothetical protein
MATEKQIAANRRNASKSTGPRTERGRAFMRLNALRHGLYAAAGIPRDASLKELAQIRGEFVRSYRPETAEHIRLAEQMATAQWLCHYWHRTETRVLGQAAASSPARQVSLFDRFSLRQAHYQRAFMKAYREYQRSK